MTQELLKDPENYRAMSVPFDSPDKANEALRAFREDVRAARNKHRIMDVTTIVAVNVKYTDEEGMAITVAHDGEASKAHAMAAYAFGKLQEEHREFINKMLKK